MIASSILLHQYPAPATMMNSRKSHRHDAGFSQQQQQQQLFSDCGEAQRVNEPRTWTGESSFSQLHRNNNDGESGRRGFKFIDDHSHNYVPVVSSFKTNVIIDTQQQQKLSMSPSRHQLREHSELPGGGLPSGNYGDTRFGPSSERNRGSRGNEQEEFEGTVQKIQCFKTKRCRFWMENRCSRGASCTYAHTEVELRMPPNLSKTKLCTRWQKGICSKPADACCYAHGFQELRTVRDAVSSEEARQYDMDNEDAEDRYSGSRGNQDSYFRETDDSMFVGERSQFSFDGEKFFSRGDRSECETPDRTGSRDEKGNGEESMLAGLRTPGSVSTLASEEDILGQAKRTVPGFASECSDGSLDSPASYVSDVEAAPPASVLTVCGSVAGGCEDQDQQPLYLGEFGFDEETPIRSRSASVYEPQGLCPSEISFHQLVAVIRSFSAADFYAGAGEVLYAE